MASVAPAPASHSSASSRPQILLTKSTNTLVSSELSTPLTPRSRASSLPPEHPDTEQRGRLKRRRMSSHSPARAPSPSRGHDRGSGSRYRHHHHRKHHRADSSPSISPPRSPKKNRRRSDAEIDHTLRGRARNRSQSCSRSPLLEGNDGGEVVGGMTREERKRDQPPSRARFSDTGLGDGGDDKGKVRRQRSMRNLYEMENGGTGYLEKDKKYDEDGEGRIKPLVQGV